MEIKYGRADQKIKINKMRNKKNTFPYQDYESIPAWKILGQAIEELERNKDLIIQTDKRYIIGFILKEFVKNVIVELNQTNQP